MHSSWLDELLVVTKVAGFGVAQVGNGSGRNPQASYSGVHFKGARFFASYGFEYRKRASRPVCRDSRRKQKFRAADQQSTGLCSTISPGV